MLALDNNRNVPHMEKLDVLPKMILWKIKLIIGFTLFADEFKITSGNNFIYHHNVKTRKNIIQEVGNYI